MSTRDGTTSYPLSLIYEYSNNGIVMTRLLPMVRVESLDCDEVWLRLSETLMLLSVHTMNLIGGRKLAATLTGRLECLAARFAVSEPCSLYNNIKSSSFINV